jgi:Arc/MetJ-type ribon-helix-helix transcriptional regulator
MKYEKQIRVRLSQSQLDDVESYIKENYNEFKNKSELIRKSIENKIYRRNDIISKSLGKSKN